MDIRPLAAADAPAYRHLMLQAYERADHAFTSTPEERAAQPLAWWQARIADAQGLSQAFGAFVAGELVGGVAIEFNAKPKTRHKALVIGMYVDDACRGRGAGKRLLEAAIAHARERGGIIVLTLTVSQGNAAAIGLYEGFGFETFGVEPMAIRTAAGYLAKRHLWLDLSRARP